MQTLKTWFYNQLYTKEDVVESSERQIHDWPWLRLDTTDEVLLAILCLLASPLAYLRYETKYQQFNDDVKMTYYRQLSFNSGIQRNL